MTQIKRFPIKGETDPIETQVNKWLLKFNNSGNYKIIDIKYNVDVVAIPSMNMGEMDINLQIVEHILVIYDAI